MGKTVRLKDTGEKVNPLPGFPVGAIYLSVSNTNPREYFGGTWELIAQGRTLVGVDTNDTDFNTVKKTGGEKTHTLTVNEMPSHTHTLFWANPGSGGGAKYIPWNTTVNQLTGGDPTPVGYNGGSQPHNNLQPYFTCYIWCRTA